MGSKGIEIKSLIFSLAAVLGSELILAWLIPQGLAPPLAMLGLLRLADIGLIFLTLFLCGSGPAAVGLAWFSLGRGMRTGLIWSAAFSLAALGGWGLLYLLDFSPADLIRTNLPTGSLGLILFFVVGGVIGPVAEEVVFRGLLFGFFRRWGLGPALVLSLLAFVLAHVPQNRMPVPQVIGGLVFTLAYEKSRNLMVPITIHVLGNLSVFALAFWFQKHSG